MGLISHAAAAGLGYALARPEGRRQLRALSDRGRRLLQHPQIVRLRTRAQQLAAKQITTATTTVTQKLGRSDPSPTPPASRHAADVEPPGHDPT